MTIRWFFITLLLIAGFARAAEPEILDPSVAFKFSVKALSDSELEVTYNIAPGYYLYREKFAFASESANVKLGNANIPNGKVKQDEFFGRIETLRDEVRIVIPISRAGNAANWKFSATSQGCADIGVCFPPHTEEVTFKPDGSIAGNGGGGLAALDAAAPSANVAAPAGAQTMSVSAPLTNEAANLSETDQIAQIFASKNFWLIVASFFGFGLAIRCLFMLIDISRMESLHLDSRAGMMSR